MTRKLNKNNLSERLKPKIINNNNFPSDREIEEITKKVSAPNYPYANYILPDNAGFSEKIKYEIAQKILAYQQDNKLSYEEIAQKIGLTFSQTMEILRGNVAIFALDSLINYVEQLHLPLQVKITNQNQIKYQINKR